MHKSKALVMSFVMGVVLAVGAQAYAEKQGHMARALKLLEGAQDALKDATADKGGYRVKALEAVKQAIEATKAGIEFDNANPKK